METIVTNTNTSGIIQNQNIVRNTDNGVTIHNRNCWRFVSKQYIEEDIVSSDYYRPEPETDRTTYQNTNPDLAYSETVSSQYTEKLERRFGFTDLVISTRQAAADSAILSEEIDVARADYVTVDCQIVNQECGAIELSILDNADETPILPNQSRFVEKEKLWYGLETRFLQDRSQPIILYEDGQAVSRDYASLSVDDFKRHTYALSYVAAQDYDRYRPRSQKVMVKAVIRQYEDTPFIEIQNLIVHKHGETITWNSRQ